MAQENQWHLSKSFNVSFILAVSMQTVTLIWFIADLAASIERNTIDLARHDTRIENLEATSQQQAVTLARIDENVQALKLLMERRLP